MKNLILTLSLIFTLGLTNAFATGIIGSDITYKSGPVQGMYEVTLTMYRWCGGLPLCTENCNFSSCTQTIIVTGDSSNTTYALIQATLVNVVEVSLKGGKNCPSQLGGTTCKAFGCSPPLGTNPGVEKYTFKGYVDLGPTSGIPANVCNVRLTFGNFEREYNYDNLGANPYYNYAIINRCASIATNNSSPTYLNDPQFSICNGSLYQNNHSAFDADWQDSLTFSLVPAMRNYNVPCDYTAPYTHTLPVPASVVTCDKNTGELKLIPTYGSNQDFKGIIVIETKQWRNINGVATLMGITRREWDLFILGDCQNNASPYITINPLSINNLNTPVLQYNTCAKQQLCFTITAKDSDITDTAFLEWDSSLVRYGATFTPISGLSTKDANYQFCWTPDDSIARRIPYFFTVRVRDSRCPNNAKLIYTIKVRVLADPQLSISTKQVNCNTVKLKYTQNNSESELLYPHWQIARKPDDPLFANGFLIYPASNITSFSKGIAVPGTYYIRLVASVGAQGFTYQYCSKSVLDSVYIDSAKIGNNSKATDITCFGYNNGKMLLEAKDGVPPYQYRVNPEDAFGSKNIYTGLSKGKYYIAMRDQQECEITDSLLVSEPQKFSLSSMVEHVLCYNDSSGSIQSAASGGIPPYLYYFNAVPSSTITFNQLKAGKYIVSAKDSNLCMAYDTVYVHQNSEIKISSIFTPHPCNGLGNLTVNGTGGTATFDYALNQLAFQPSNMFPISQSGNYNIAVRDSNNCMKHDSVFIQLPDSFVATSTFDEISCHNAKDGKAQLYARGGINGNYTFRIVNQPSNTTGLFTQLDSGTYQFLIKDGNNCNKIITHRFTNPPQIIIGYIIGDSASNRGLTKAYSITPQPGLQYTWIVTGGTITSGQGTSTVNVNWKALGTGSIAVMVMDSNQCSNSTSRNILIGNVGMNELKEMLGISIYPNPAKQLLYINLKTLPQNSQWHLFDIQGKLLLGGELKLSQEIDIEKIPAGIYVLKVGEWYGQIVKE